MAIIKNHLRSISFPSRSHSSTTAIREELNKLRTQDFSAASTSGSISAGLSGLEDLHRCTDELLRLASTQKVLSQDQNQKFVDELLDGSVRLIDICSVSRDFAAKVGEHVIALQSALRRRKGDSSIESSILSYTRFRKNMLKEAKTLMSVLNKMETETWRSSPNVDDDLHLPAVIQVLREVNVMTVSMFLSLLTFLSLAPKPKRGKWLQMSQLMHKGTVACEAKEEIDQNELQTLDAELKRYIASTEEAEAEKKPSLYKRLKALESKVEGLENCLESLFRRSLKTRASLLNKDSQ